MSQTITKRRGLTRLLYTLVNSGRALRWLLRHEEAFQLESVLALTLLPSVYFIASSPLQASVMVAVTLLVLMVEALNTAIEVVVDRISTEHHSLSGLAKDLGSLAVTLALLIWLAVWVPIVWPLITRYI